MRISDWSSDVCSSDLVRMQADVHDPATGRPFRIEDVEFLDQRLRELVGGEILARDEGEVVDLVRIGGRDDRPVRGAQQIGLIVVHDVAVRSEEHTSELQSLMRISYAVFCLKNKKYILNTIKSILKASTHKKHCF